MILRSWLATLLIISITLMNHTERIFLHTIYSISTQVKPTNKFTIRSSAIIPKLHVKLSKIKSSSIINLSTLMKKMNYFEFCLFPTQGTTPALIAKRSNVLHANYTIPTNFLANM